jgi:hypothetical protein
MLHQTSFIHSGDITVEGYRYKPEVQLRWLTIEEAIGQGRANSIWRLRLGCDNTAVFR